MSRRNARRRRLPALAFLALSALGSISCSSVPKPEEKSAAAPPRAIVKELRVPAEAPAICRVACAREPDPPPGVREDASLGLPMDLAIDVTAAGRDCRAKHDACAAGLARQDGRGASP